MQPVPGRITTSFSSDHQGTDYAAGIGTPIKAPKAGVIASIPGVPSRQLYGSMQNGNAWSRYEDNPNGRHSGNVINIRHDDGTYTSYLHVSPYTVSNLQGKRVNQGQTIGYTGHNGWSTGPHLHFEVSRNGVRIDPVPWLKAIKREYPMDRDTIVLINREYVGYDPSPARVKYWLGKNPKDFMLALRKQSGFTRKSTMIERIKQLESSNSQTKFKTLADKVKALIPFTK